MKKFKLESLFIAFLLFIGLGIFTGQKADASAISGVNTVGNYMYRLYNPNSGEHFYTASISEEQNTVSSGWKFEGVGWIAPKSGSAVYRLYNPNAGDHFYTMSAFERDQLKKVGWNYEGIGWKSGGSVALLRAYNPNVTVGTHNYTTSQFEQNSLANSGWRKEGVAWYGVGGGIKAAASMNFVGIVYNDKQVVVATCLFGNSSRTEAQNWAKSWGEQNSKTDTFYYGAAQLSF